jgi:hypothetical protein
MVPIYSKPSLTRSAMMQVSHWNEMGGLDDVESARVWPPAATGVTGRRV